MSQMEPLTINYTCHASRVSRGYICTFIFTRFIFKWKVNRTWINMIKRHWSYKRNHCHSKHGRKKNVTGLFHKGYFKFLFTRTHFAYFNNTAKSKRKKKSQYWLCLGNCPLVITDTLVKIFLTIMCRVFHRSHWPI